MSAEVEISWKELEGSDLPKVCFRCGADADEFVSVEIEADNFFEEMSASIPLPLCPGHAERSAVLDHGVRADTFHKRGVIFKNACEGFVDALDDYRDDPKRFKKAARRREEDGVYDKYKYGTSRGGRAVRSGVRKGLVFGCLGLVLALVGVGAAVAVLAGGGGKGQPQQQGGRFGR